MFDIGVTFASMLMIVIMLPFFLFAMYEQHGQPLEVILRHIVFNANTFPFETPHACMLDNSHAEEKSKDDFCGIQWRMPLFFMLAISTGEWYHSTCNFEFSFPRGAYQHGRDEMDQEAA